MKHAPTSWPHAPTHWLYEQGTYIVTCGTYQKKPLLNSATKRTLVQNKLFEMAKKYEWHLQAWAIMSNHYHFVASSPTDAQTLKPLLSELHTSTATALNRMDKAEHRRVWYNYFETHITYEKSWLARLNYVHNNPVHHKLVENAEQYEWCSAAWFKRESSSAFVKTVQSFKTDQVKVYDEYALECAGSTALLNTDEQPSLPQTKQPESKSGVKLPHSKEPPPPMKKKTDHYAHLCRLAGKAVHDFNMIKEGDRLLVGISGGVDSMMLMHVLARLQKRAPIHFELFSVTIDEGFDGIQHAPLAHYAQEQGWHHHIIEAPIAQLIPEKEVTHKPCGLCSRLRRGYIHRYADEMKCNKLVLGHHRDDLCVSLLMGLYRGTGLKTMGPNVPGDHGTKRVIRPLCYAPKDLIETAALDYDFPDVGACDYSAQLDENGDRAFLERELNRLKEHFPDIGKNMLNSMADVRPNFLLDPRHFTHPEHDS